MIRLIKRRGKLGRERGEDFALAAAHRGIAVTISARSEVFAQHLFGGLRRVEASAAVHSLYGTH